MRALFGHEKAMGQEGKRKKMLSSCAREKLGKEEEEDERVQ